MFTIVIERDMMFWCSQISYPYPKRYFDATLDSAAVFYLFKVLSVVSVDLRLVSASPRSIEHWVVVVR